jgi:hypothetical protein
MSNKNQANKNYKDTVFRLLFNDAEKSAELFNAINGTNIKPKDIEINTIQNPFYYGNMRNDLSFSAAKKLINIHEHQSTFSPNIGLRCLFYISDIYKQQIQGNIDDLYKTTPMSIETPSFYVLYNGKAKYPEKKVLKLSDLYRVKDDRAINLELTVTVYNVKKGHNKSIMERSNTLNEYALFVDKVQKYKDKKYEETDAMNKAIEECVRENILKEFLIQFGGEVVNTLNLEWKLEDALRVKGQEEAIKAKEEVAIELLDVLDVETIAKKTKLSIDRVSALKVIRDRKLKRNKKG